MSNLPEELQGTYGTKDWKKGDACLVLKIDGTSVSTTLHDAAEKEHKPTLSGTLDNDYDKAAHTVTLKYKDKNKDDKTVQLAFTKTDTKNPEITMDPAHVVTAVMPDATANKADAITAATAAKDLVRVKGPEMKWYMALVAVLALFGIYFGYDKLEHKKRR